MVNVLLVLLLIKVLTSCTKNNEDKIVSQEYLLAKSKEFQACNENSDCIVVGSFCDIGCNVAINKVHSNEFASLREKMSGNSCKLTCSKVSLVECVSGRCEAGIVKPEK